MFTTPRSRFILLLVIMVILALVVAGVSMKSMHDAHLDHDLERLSALAKSQARLVQTFYHWEQAEIHPEEDLTERLARFLANAHEGWYEGLGKSGEIVFAEKHGEEIIFLFRQRHGDSNLPKPVSWSKRDLAEPMRRALSGESGVIVAPDYRGVPVQAAFEPIPEVNMGVVVKVDLAELRLPMYRAVFLATLASAILILVGGIFFSHIGEGVIQAHQNALEHLRQSRQALDEAQEIARLGSWRWHLNGNDWEISAGLVRILGLPEGVTVLPGAWLLDRIHPEERSRFRALLDRVRDWKEEASGEFRLLRADGQTVMILAQCIHGESVSNTKIGQLSGAYLTGTFQDITESKSREQEFLRMNRALKALSMASQALLEAGDEKRFLNKLCQLVVEQAGYRLAWVGLAEHDAQQSVIPVAQFGCEAGYLETLSITWSDSERGRGPTGSAIRTGKPALARNIPEDPVYQPWRQQAMARGFGSSIALPLFANQGTIGALSIYAAETDAFDASEIGFLSDLANNVSLGIGLLRQTRTANRLMAAVEQIEEMVLITDLQGEIEYVNPAFLKGTGFSESDALGQNIRIVRSGQTAPGLISEMWLALEQGRTWQGVFNNSRKDGSLFKAAAVISPVKDREGLVSNYVAVYRDITLQERLETQLRQSQKMEAIGTLAGGIAHDFNNILGVIIGYSELVLKKLPADGQQHRDLEEVLTASLRARDLIAQLLAFSRQTDMREGSITLVPLVKEALRFLRAVIPANVKLSAQLSEQELGIIGNPTQIHQILMNLCTNAVQAMPMGGELSVTLEAVTVTPEGIVGLSVPAGSYAVIRVADNGAGIPPEHLSRIFDPFFTTKEVGEGTGLGLSVVHGHVTALQGRILLESRVGVGSTFEVYLPLDQLHKEHRKGVRHQDESVASLNVLVVDDEPQLVQVLAGHLEMLGCHPVVATSAGEALKRISDDPDRFQLVITDRTMPDATGEQLLRALRPLAPHLPVVLTSGHQISFSHAELQAGGFFDFLPKPVLNRDLVSLLHRLSATV
ncbi:MAG: PAS domain S-box protein [Magnetococcus sp. YQC-9]